MFGGGKGGLRWWVAALHSQMASPSRGAPSTHTQEGQGCEHTCAVGTSFPSVLNSVLWFTRLLLFSVIFIKRPQDPPEVV